MFDKELINKNAKIFANIAQISVEDSTKILLEAVKSYNIDDLNQDELNNIIDKLN